jgi:hypothetical protein
MDEWLELIQLVAFAYERSRPHSCGGEKREYLNWKTDETRGDETVRGSRKAN